MENNCNNMDPPQVNTQHNAEKTVDADALPQKVKLIYSEILQIRKDRKQSMENIKNHKQKFENLQQLLQEGRAKKQKMLKETVELQSQLNDKKFQNDALRREIGKMCKMSNEINDDCIRIQGTLEVCSQDKVTTTKRIEILNTKICDNLAKMEEMHKKKQNEVALTKESVLNQQKIQKENLMMCEKQCVEIKEKLNISNNELDSLKRQLDEIAETNCSCLNKIEECEKDNKQRENVFKNKQKRSDDLLKQMEEQLRAFEQSKKEMSNILSDTKYEIQKKEMEIKNTERGLKNQTEYNKNFREKLAVKEKQIAELRLQNKQLETIQTENQAKLVDTEKHLREELALKLKEEENAKAMWSEECNILSEAEQGKKEAEQKNEELLVFIKTQENNVSELKSKQNAQHQDISACEQKQTSLLSNHDKIKEELSKRQMQTVNYEREMLETIANKTSTVKALTAETEQTKNEKQDTVKAILQEMSSVQADFDTQVAEQTKEFEEKQKQLQNEIQLTHKEFTETRNSKIQLEQELTQLSNVCDSFTQEIKDQENFNTLQSDFELPPLFLPSSSRRTLAMSTASSLVLPPTGPTKPRAFDELSGSSAEGNVATYQQLLQYKHNKQRRRQLKDQRLQSKNASNSQNNTSRK